MQLLSQRDPRWGQRHLGVSNLTMDQKGCTTTALCMLGDYFGTYTDPGVYASNAAHYTDKNYSGGAGLILWNKIDIKGMKWIGNEPGRDDKKILEYLKDPNKGVILQVNNSTHWVLATKKNLIGADYTAADPWDGKTCNVIQKYHNITKMAFFQRA